MWNLKKSSQKLRVEWWLSKAEESREGGIVGDSVIVR
jgi:hypothetical protein